MAEVLVLGAMGNVGAEVVKSLLATGQTVRAGDLYPERVTARFGSRVEAAAFDFTRPATFAPAFEGIRGLFLMRPPQISNMSRYLFPAVDAAQAAGVSQVVFLSLIGIEQNTIAPHYKVEQYLRNSGLAFTFLRCSFFMQNLNTTHAAEIREHNEIYVPVGRARTSFIDTRDIGAVAACVLTEPSHAKQAYDLTGSQALDYYEVAELFSRALGRPITYRNPTTLAYFARLVRAGKPLAYALVTAWLYTNTRSGMAERITGEVKRLLGRDPITMAQYINDYRDSWI